MNIEEKIEEIHNYFKQKVLCGDYKFIKCEEHTAEILIDDKYTFHMWIANEPKYSFGFYGDTFFFLNGKTIELTTQKERLAGWKHIKPHIQEYKNKVLKRKKQKEINRLKKELEALK